MEHPPFRMVTMGPNAGQTVPAGMVVTLGVLHGTEMRDVVVTSIDRKDFVRRKPGI